MCKKCENEKFNARIYNEDESAYVDTSFTLKELRQTAAAISNLAVEKKERQGLLVASAMGLHAARIEELSKDLSIARARLDAFREDVQQACENEKPENLKEVILGLLRTDEEVVKLAEQLFELGVL